MSRAFGRSATRISTSAFIPGLSRPPRLSIITITANMVTFCCTSACGSILSTMPAKVRPGNASTVTVAVRSAEICPTSVSSTSVRTCISARLAIMKRVVPPDTFCDADWMTCPSSTFFWMMVPAMGARMVTSLRRSSASSMLVVALTRFACAFAKSRLADSCSCSVITPDSRSRRERSSWAVEISTRACATFRSASVWLKSLRTSRGSISASSAPGASSSPVSTCRRRISPEALDLTSTVRTGSIRPVASATRRRSSRRAGIVVRPGASSTASAPLQAATASSARSLTPPFLSAFVLTFISSPENPASQAEVLSLKRSPPPSARSGSRARPDHRADESGAARTWRCRARA